MAMAVMQSQRLKSAELIGSMNFESRYVKGVILFLLLLEATGKNGLVGEGVWAVIFIEIISGLKQLNMISGDLTL